MTNSPETKADKILERLKQLPPEERAAFIDEHCTSEAIRDEVLDQLRTLDGDLGDFLASPAVRRDELEGVARRLVGPYRLLQEIGEGGFGIVYMAEQERPVRRQVAVKVLKPGMDSREIIARFEAERQALAMMSHPNIATVLDVGTTDEGHPYFVMELVKGIPITEFCDKASLSPKERLELVCEVCHAIEHAHQKGIIHRDLKPSNILVTLHGDTSVPKVIDFGVAKALNQPLTEKTLFTRFGQMVGTPAYMSPEQAEVSGLDVDTRSDVYSLGVLLYELLTGTIPLDTERLQAVGIVEVQRMICEDEPPTPSTRVKSLGDGLAGIATRRRVASSKLRQLLRGELDWIVMRALEKDRARRYQGANALAADIERYLAGDPVEACPPAATYRFLKFVRKYRVSLSVGATVLVVLAVATAVSVWQAIVASEERDRAVLLAGRLDQSLADARELAERASASAREASEKRQVAQDLADEANRLRLAAEEAGRRLRWQVYVSDMNRIGPMYAEGNIRQARRLLEGHRPKPGDTDLRGFEWYYWWGAIRRERRTLYRPTALGTGPNYGMAVSPGYQWIAVPCHPGEVQVFDVAGSRRVRTLHPGDDPRYASFSPDGTILAVGAGERITLFDVANDWTWLRQLGLSGGWQEARLVFSPNGRTLASATPEGAEITLWDTETWNRTVSTVEAFSLGSNLAFSPDGRLLAFGSSRGEFRVVVWDVASREIRKNLRGHEGRVLSVAWSPDGRLLVSGSVDRAITLWNAENLERMATLRVGATVTALAFSPDSSYLAAAMRENNSVVVWNTDSTELAFSVKGHEQPVTGLAFVGDSATLWTVSTDGLVKIWDLPHTEPAVTIPLGPARRDLLQPFRSDLALWRSSSFLGLTSVSGRQVVLAHEHGKRIQRWSPDGKDPQVPWDDNGSYAAAGLSYDGRFLVTGTSDGRLQILDGADADRVMEQVVEPAMLEDVMSTMVSRDGQIVALASRVGGRKEIVVYDRKRGTRRRIRRDGGDFLQAVVSPDGKQVAVRLVFALELWDLQAVEPTLRSRGVRGGPPRCLAFSPDGKTLAVGCWDNNIYVYDVKTFAPTLTLVGHVGQVTCLAFSPDGEHLVSGSVDKTLRLWNLDTGDILSSLTGHRGIVDWVTWASDGHALLSASTEGGSLKIWHRATQAEVEQDVGGLVDLAWNQEADADWPAVLATLDEAIDIAPVDPHLRLWRGRIEGGYLGRILDALVDFGEAAGVLLSHPSFLRSIADWLDVRPLAASSRRRDLSWRFTTEPPDDDAWKTLEFDDASWQSGEGPFASAGGRTEWRSSEIWLRHEFELEEVVETPLVLFALIDDQAEFYVNGKLAGRGNFPTTRDRFNFQRIDSDLSPQALRIGRNILAVRCLNLGGEARIDVGLHTASPTAESDELISRLMTAAPDDPRALGLRSRFQAGREK